MYRVLLVDDEPWAIKGLMHVFPWAEYGFQVTATANDSMKAFDILTRDAVDVVFSDIRMPEITGIQLMNMAREKDIDSEFVFISGFSDFEYLKSAIKGGAADYLLKPVASEDAEELLKKLAVTLGSKAYANDTRLYERLLEGTLSFTAEAEKRGLSFRYSSFQAVEANFPDESKRLEDILPSNAQAVPIRLGSQKLAAIVNTDNDLYQYVNAFCGDDYRKADFTIGISNLAGGCDKIADLLREAAMASLTPFITNAPGVYRYETKGIGKINGQLTAILQAIDTFDDRGLKDGLNDLIRFFRSNGVGINGAVHVWNQIVAHLMKKIRCEKWPEEFEYLDYEQLTKKFRNLEQLCDYVRSVAFRDEPLEDGGEVSTDVIKAFNRLVCYIDEHINEKLWLQELSAKFYLNFTYTCALFKKLKGTTFTRYVTEKRMNKAKELLANTQYSIDQVCGMAGFSDYFYFNKIFKKTYGVTPLKYRTENTAKEM